MKITKYEHACLDIKEGSSRLIVDPGELSPSLTDFAGVTAVVITHVHGDHFDEAKVESIVSANPAAQIFTTSEVQGELKDKTVIVPKIGQIYTAGDFTLEFYGEMHEMVDPKTPLVQNIGVLVNNTLYYPGDSYTPCPKPFKVLAMPKSGPWFRVSDALPLFENSTCQLVFPTHDGLLNEVGSGSVDNWFKQFAERNNKTYQVLTTGQSIGT